MIRLLLPLSLLLSLSLAGQTRDTIPVIMLVSDTVKDVTPMGLSQFKNGVSTEIYYSRYNPIVTWQYGYEVMEWPDKNGYVIIGTLATFVGYLDENKKPLTLMVWMSKEIKK